MVRQVEQDALHALAVRAQLDVLEFVDASATAQERRVGVDLIDRVRQQTLPRRSRQRL